MEISGIEKKDEGEEKDDNEYEFLIPISSEIKTKSIVDRYFKRYYFRCSSEGKCLDQYIFLHTNKYFESRNWVG